MKGVKQREWGPPFIWYFLQDANPKDTDVNSILNLFKPEIYYLLPCQIHLEPRQSVPIVIPIYN